MDLLELDIGRAAHAVTKALDYVGIDDKSHGRRVGLICHRMAHHLGWAQDRRHFILIAGMLHDCGVSSTAIHQKLCDTMEWDGAEEHCLRGEAFLSSFSPFRAYAPVIRYHHTRWEDLPASLPAPIAEAANLIFYADRLDVAQVTFRQDHSVHDLLLERQTILDSLQPYCGSLFDPALQKAAQALIQRDSFWLELQDDYLDEAIFETLDDCNHRTHLGFPELEALGELVSKIVDAKSPFTHAHSLRVADLAYSLAGYLGYDETQKRTLRLAGLLHDVGKLRTPDAVLEKPNKLSPKERAQMKCHPMDSKHVLKGIFPNTPLPKWVSAHHEKLNGSGYPYGWCADQIDQPTRILTIADIFQALAQDRPYRGRLSLPQILSIMDNMAAQGEIDPTLYTTLRQNAAPLFHIATESESLLEV
jgi:putative nucleotidyltransferase with HDIG domain